MWKLRNCPVILVLLLSVQAAALTISMPMIFLNIAKPAYITEYYRALPAGRIASVIHIGLTKPVELVLSDIEMPGLENNPIRKVFLRPSSTFAAFDLSRATLHAARSSNLYLNDLTGRSWPYVVASEIYLEHPRDTLENYFETLPAQAVAGLELVIQTANAKEYALTFADVGALKRFLGLAPALLRNHPPPPSLCAQDLSAKATERSPPYLRLVE